MLFVTVELLKHVVSDKDIFITTIIGERILSQRVINGIIVKHVSFW